MNKYGEWQPIETAPKDGTAVLMVDANEQVVAKWMEPLEGGEGGWVMFRKLDFSFGNALAILFPNPTHWMPLPYPPRVET